MKDLEEYKNVPISVAAKLLDVSPSFIRIGLQRNRLPFGTAVNIQDGKKWTYHISPGILKEYINGDFIKEINNMQTKKALDQSKC